MHCSGVQYVNHKAVAIRPIFATLKSQKYFRANLSYCMVQSCICNSNMDAKGAGLFIAQGREAPEGYK